MNNEVLTKLLNYQVPHVYSLIYAFDNSNIIIDSSDTGTGKTYCSLAVVKHFGLKPIIICPKSVINNWENVCQEFDIEPEVIMNYEKVINGNVFKNTNIFPFVIKTTTIIKSKKVVVFDWNLSNNHILIMDEVHRCKNINTLHSSLLLGLKNINNKVMMLSATLADKIKLFKNFGYLMGFYDSPRKLTYWIKKNKKNLDASIFLNKQLFPNYGGRMRIKELGDMFPKNNVISKCYQMNNTDKIAESYKDIQQSYTDLKNKIIDASILLTKIIRARQSIEILKIPTFIKLIQDNLIENKSVVIFVNFNETLKILAEHFNIKCQIHGDQTGEERNTFIKLFQSNEEKIIIANIKAGGVGISLHDLMGSHPRVSIISPTWSAQDFIQTLGRIHRANAKTPATQYIVFCEGTIEEFICATLDAKLEHLSKLNDGDIDTYNIDKNQETINSMQGDDSIKKYHSFNPMPKKINI